MLNRADCLLGTRAAIFGFALRPKAWGFITYNGGDVFVHQKDCLGNPPQVGDILTFDVTQGPDGKSKAGRVSLGRPHICSLNLWYNSSK